MRIDPALTCWPPNRLTPSRLPQLSLPLLALPLDVLWAIRNLLYFAFFFGEGLTGASFLGLVGFFFFSGLASFLAGFGAAATSTFSALTGASLGWGSGS